MKKVSSIILFFSFFLIFCLFFIKSNLFIDSDFGWHFRIGEIILNQGLPKTDPLSYTMPSFPYIDHEWLVSIIIAKLYPNIGFLGLSVIFALIPTLALFIVTPKKLSLSTTIPLTLAATILLPYVGIRAQLFTWLFLAILWQILIWKKFKFLIPVLFTIWANFHGGFAIGITILIFYIALDFLKNQNLSFSDSLLFVLSLSATFINPYGTRIWEEVFRTVSDGSLRWTISEWAPITFKIDFAFLFLLALALVLIFRYKLKVPIFQMGLFFILLVAGLTSLRHIPLWTIITLPLVSLILELFKTENSQSKLALSRLNLGYNLLFLIALTIAFAQTILVIKSSQSYNLDHYPTKAVEFLKLKHLTGNLFSTYNWGGYLDWKYPQKKVFIDGRMPTWKNNNAPAGESKLAFEDYLETISNQTKAAEIFAKYNIRVVLWTAPKNRSYTTPNFIPKEWQAFINNLFEETAKGEFNPPDKNSWIKVYQDEVAIIYVKSGND